MRDRLREAGSMLAVGLRIDRPLTISLVTLTLLTNLAMTLRALWFALLVDAVVDGALGQVTTWAVVLAASDAVRSWALVGSQMDRQDLHDKALQHFQEEAMRLAGSLPGIEHHEHPDHIDRLAAYRGSFSSLSGALGNVVDAIANAARAAVTLALLVALHPVLVLLPLFALPSLATARKAERIRQLASLDTLTDGRRHDHLYALVVEPAPAKETKVFGTTGWLRRRHDGLWRSVTGAHQRARFKAAAVAFAGWVVFAAAYVGALVLLVARAAAGDATAGDVLLGVVLVGQVNGQVATGAQLVGGLTQATVAIAHRRWLLDYVQAHQRRPSTASPPSPPSRLDDGIRLHQVTFRYPETDRNVLHEVDLHLPAGAVVALVGENGAGKTSLVKLLAGLYTPTRGTITVDGTDLGDLDPGDWRQRITTGFQDFARFSFLARETVGAGDLPRLDDPAAIADALARAQATSLAHDLPAGLDTQLGLPFGGIEISGGQWQKLALGRAMMRPQPLLLILDEPTAALDAPSEHALFDRYTAAARHARPRGAITLLVSHRFSTVRSADLIVVLEGGRVTQRGSHAELVSDPDGLYAQLYEVQARAYT